MNTKLKENKLKERILNEMVYDEVNISNNKLLLLTGTLNYFIDTKPLPKKKNAVRLNLVKYLEKEVDECGIIGDKEKDEKLRDLKHESIVTTLKLTREQIILLVEGVDHFQLSEGAFSKNYLEIKDHLENILQEKK